MANTQIDWKKIRTHKASQQEGFEELICQLASQEYKSIGSFFHLGGSSDGGVECYLKLEDGSEYGWQAKYLFKLGTGEISQIKKSLKQAIKTHPNLTRYYVCLPMNLADPRVLKSKKEPLKGFKSSSMSRWDDFKEWVKKDDSYSAIEIVYWGESKLLNLLIQPKNIGMRYYWFNEKEFHKESWQSQTSASIKRLGDRYLPVLHQELAIERRLSFLHDGGQRFKSDFENVFYSYRITNENLKRKLLYNSNYIKVLVEINTSSVDLMKSLCEEPYKKIKDLYNFIDWFDPSRSSFHFFAYIEKFLQSLWDNYYYDLQEKFSDFNKQQDNIKNQDYYQKQLLKDLEYLGFSLNEIKQLKEDSRSGYCEYGDLFFSWSANIKSTILIQGDAGIGKSHLLAMMASISIENDIASFFFLGSDFRKNDDPWDVILRKLRIDFPYVDRNEFLGALNAHGKAIRKKSLIFIDALDEGDGARCWNEYFELFVDEIEKYPWIGLIMSIRSSYSSYYSSFYQNNKTIWHQKILHLTHEGFGDEEDSDDLIKSFFLHFGIEYPSFPFLDPELYNPLFLITLCKTLKFKNCKTVPENYEFIFSGYLDSISEKISEKLFIEKKILLQILMTVGNVISKSESNFCVYDQLIKKIEIEFCSLGDTRAVDVLKAFLSEGILFKDIYYPESKADVELGASFSLAWNNKREISLFDEADSFECIRFTYGRLQAHILARSFYSHYKSGKCQFPDVITEVCQQDELEILESFMLIFAKQEERDLLSITNSNIQNEIFIEAFLKSLVWRSTNSITHDTKLKFYELLNNRKSQGKAFEILLYCSGRKSHPFNALYLHEWLKNMSLCERDGQWSAWIGMIEYWNNSDIRPYHTHESREKRNSLLSEFTPEENCRYPLQRLINWARAGYGKGNILTAIPFVWMLSTSYRPIRDQVTKVLVLLFEGESQVTNCIFSMFKYVNDSYILERLILAIYGAMLRSTVDNKWKKIVLAVYERIFLGDEVYPHLLVRHYARRIVEFGILKKIIDMSTVDLEAITPPYNSKWIEPERSTHELQSKISHEDRGLKLIMDSILPKNLTWSGKDFWAYSYDTVHFSHDELPQEKQGRIVFEKILSMEYDERIHGMYDNIADSGVRRIESGPERLGKKYIWQGIHELEARAIDSGYWKADNYSNEIYNDPLIDTFRVDLDPTVDVFFQPNNNNGIWQFLDFEPQWELEKSKWIKNKSLSIIKDIILQGERFDKQEIALYGAQSFYPPSDYPERTGFIDFWFKSFVISEGSIEEAVQKLHSDYFSDKYKKIPDFLAAQLGNLAYDNFFDEIYHYPSDKQYTTFLGEETVTSFHDEKGDDPESPDNVNYLIPTNFLYKLLNLKKGQQSGSFQNTDNQIIFYNSSEQYAVVKLKELASRLEENNLTILWVSFVWCVNQQGILNREIMTLDIDTDKMKIKTLFSDQIDN